ncbi:glycerol-3-phosphate 1-O-acyltransferase PlsY [Chelatococcus reniformis]|uniref:Glycerol-3-phosphate acyltransferase n=1 Tax=Chelatococcus reniformis TaxID=1494448 RepID=A0A916X9G3_9HYPH|nr:glycerol-3-phosphate 1-O-acyltransferase PlsY [Chelatococcus reniformis]GGC57239.1 glycerol-3-phosphate acyltransferase [Chelatococcus reniformis]
MLGGDGWPYLAAALAIGYALGSIPFGVVLTRLAGLGDLRRVGSGNIGATNVLRTGHKGLAAATLLGDALKGTVAVLICARWGTGAALAAALGAFLGHLFPVWLKFRGGKGVATFLGCLIAVEFVAALGFALVWLLFAFITRFSSLAALVASALTPVALLALGSPHSAALFALLTALLWWKHRDNIRRLLAGEESRIGAK